MLHIIPAYATPQSNFLFSAVKDDDTAFITIEESFIGKVLRCLRLRRVGLLFPRFFARVAWRKETFKELEAIKATDTLLLWQIVPAARQIARIVKASRKYLWIWNTLPKDYPQRHIDALKRDYQSFTFDKNDARVFGLNHKHQVYCLPPRDALHLPPPPRLTFILSEPTKIVRLCWRN